MNKRTVLSFVFLVATLNSIISTPVDWQKIRDAVYTLHLTFREHHGFPPELVAQCIGGVLQDSERYTREERLEIAFSFMKAYQGRAERIIFDFIHTIPDLAQGPEGPPLIYASNNGYDQVVQTLLGAGAEVNARDNYSKTALMIAAANGHNDVVKTLINRGADVNVRNYYWRTALMLAAFHGHRDVVQTLLGAGAAINAQDASGITALVIATRRGHDQVVQTLLNVDAQSADGETALMETALNDRDQVVQILRRHIENHGGMHG